MKSTFHIISPAPSNFFRPYLALYLQAMNKFASGGQINTYDQSGFVTVDPSSQFCYLILKRFFYAAYTYMTPPPPLHSIYWSTPSYTCRPTQNPKSCISPGVITCIFTLFHGAFDQLSNVLSYVFRYAPESLQNICLLWKTCFTNMVKRVVMIWLIAPWWMPWGLHCSLINTPGESYIT